MFINFKKLVFSHRANSIVRRIAWLSLISITLSVMCFLVVLFVMNGMNKNIERRTLLLEPHLVFSYTKSSNDTIADVVDKKKFQDELLVHAKGFFNEELKFADRFEKQDVILRTYDGQFRSATARGVSVNSLNNLYESLNLLFKDRFREQAFSEEDLPSSDEVLIGVDLARALNILPGDYITLILPESLVTAVGSNPQIVKLQVKKIISTDIQDLDSQMIYYRIDTKNFMLKSSRGLTTGVEMWFQQGYEAHKFKNKFDQYLKQQNFANQNYFSDTWRERNSAIFFALKVEKIMIGLILALAGLIASSSIVTVMLLLISEKRRDIAILKTLGLSNKKTIEVFTKIGFSVAQIGLMVGLVFGLVLGFILEFYPIRLNQDIYYDPVVPAAVHWPLVLGVFVIGTVLAFLGTYLPAKTVSEVSITKSIKNV